MRIAKKNEAQLSFPKELGVKQRYLMLVLHSSWYISMVIEYHYRSNIIAPKYWVILILIFSGYIRYQTMRDLGIYWNTKIFELKGHQVIKTGLYKYFPQPNYAIVVLEVFFIPFMFHLNLTAIFFSIVNMMFLVARIKLEQNEINNRST